MNEKLTPTTADELLRGGAAYVNVPGHSFAFAQSRDPLRPKKAAIMGTQPSSRVMAPFADPTWTIWGSSPGNMAQLPRVDAWFELHVNLMWTEYRSYGEPYLRWLREQTFPVVMWDQRYLPNALPYPRREMVKRFGPYFFSSTFAWMMAYAISVGVEAVGLFGVDMSSKDEYIQQRPGGHYFIQRAKEAGIDVVIPDESDLLQPPPLYGWSDATPYSRKLTTRATEIKTQLTPLEAQINQGQQQAVYLRGALENITYMQAVWGGAADNMEEPILPTMALPPTPPMPDPIMPAMYVPPFPRGYVVTTPPGAPPGAPMVDSPPTAPTNSGGEHDERVIPDHL